MIKYVTFKGDCPHIEDIYEIKIEYKSLPTMNDSPVFGKMQSHCKYAKSYDCTLNYDCPIFKNAPNSLG